MRSQGNDRMPSHSVHTIGMLFTIDVIFLDRAKRVVHLEEHVRAFRVSKISLKAQSVLEVPPHTIFRTGTRVGDHFEIRRIGDCRASFDRVEPIERAIP